MALFRWIYASKTESLLSEKALDAILIEERTNLIQYNVVGLILYARQRVLGILEGQETELYAVRGCIERDTRHIGMTNLKYYKREKQEFTDMSMAYVRSGRNPPPGFVALTPNADCIDKLPLLESETYYYLKQFWASAFA